MSTHDEPFEDKIPDAQQTRIEKIRGFVRQYETPLACGATAGFAFMLGRKVGLVKVEKIEFDLARLRGEFNELWLEHGTAFEFIDSKNLREKYFVFAREQYEAA